jgi:hypothetical protein
MDRLLFAKLSFPSYICTLLQKQLFALFRNSRCLQASTGLFFKRIAFYFTGIYKKRVRCQRIAKTSGLLMTCIVKYQVIDNRCKAFIIICGR